MKKRSVTNICKIDKIAQSELNYLENWFNNEFGHIKIEWSKPKWYLTLKVDVNIIGRIGILKRKVNVEKLDIDVGGISGVILKKEWRGQKLSRLMLKKASDFIKNDLGLDFALLLCDDKVVPIYRKLNWYVVEGPTVFKQSTGIIKYSKNTMILDLSNKKWPRGKINLNGLPW